MLPPSFQTTLLALEGKLRQLQTLERTVLQAAALEDENVAYCTASQLADACEQAVLLARALPACTGRPHVFLELGKQVESPSPVEIGFTREGWFSLRMPMLLPKKERNAMGAAIGTTALNSAMTPAAVGEADPTMMQYVDMATAQCATASVVTLFLCPFITAFFDKLMQKKQLGIYSPEGWARYKVDPSVPAPMAAE